MNIVPRIPITSAMITSTNATDVADYSAGTTYAQGDVVKDATSYATYESVQSGNTGNDPTTDDGTWWVRVGFANSRRMFDGLLSAQTERAESLTVELDIGELYTSVVCFNVAGASVALTITDGATEVFTQTIDMVRTDDVENIWDYFFTEPEFKTVAIFPSVPGRAGYTTTLTVDAPGATARIGEAIFGYSRFIGRTLQGSGPRFRDFSIKEANEWGEFEVSERAFTRGAEYVVGLAPQDADRTLRIIEANRAKICAFFPAADMEPYGLTVAGFLKDFEPSLPHRGITPVTIEIEGVS